MIAKSLAELAAGGASMAEVSAHAHDLVDRTDIIFAVDTLEYLQKGGRIGRASALLGSVLSLKPILRVVDGEVTSADRQRTSAKARARLLELVSERPVERATVVHTINPSVESFREAFIAATGLDPGRVAVGVTGPVAGAHVGPGMLGVTLILTA